MSIIIHDDFLLQTKASRTLYHDYAKDQPIIDYHCHLPPEELANNVQFENLTQIWLKGDHYKWRAMRAAGVEESFITGDAGNKEKFLKWSEIVPGTVRNPLFHWTHLELNRYFGIDKYLNSETADSIYDECNHMLSSSDFSARQIPLKMNVEVICTTDDPLDSLEHHKKLKEDGYEVNVLPTFRPDNLLRVEEPEVFKPYIDKLGQKYNTEIESVDDLIICINESIDYFHRSGCRLSDHGLNYLFSADFDVNSIKEVFQQAMNGQKADHGKAEQYKSYILYELGKMYHTKGWTQQFHLGALRNNNTRLLRTLGADCGVDSIGDFPQAQNLARYFNRLDNEDALAKTIIYNLNPADNEVFATMAGNFQDGKISGKMQFGSGWWFLDQTDGMEKQINTLSNMGLISQFVGMITDSRSFLSYPRHEYFRRILCNVFGKDVEKGALPNDMNWLGGIICKICYGNAQKYFGFE